MIPLLTAPGGDGSQNLTSGRYVLFCSLPQHRSLSTHATITGR
jgi:hypothetical protein